MGEEITYNRFNKSDYSHFEKHLRDETSLLQEWFKNNELSDHDLVAGYELETWLIDKKYEPCPHNEQFLKLANNDLLSPELARFNVELNVEPQALHSSVLSDFESSLGKLWKQCMKISEQLDCNILSIGILPTLLDKHLTLDNISTLERYRALNEQVLRHRKGDSIELNIVGKEQLEAKHLDVMLEAAATSLQIHIQTPQDKAVRYYNASLALSAPLVAIGANSPFLFEKDLWEETRIPVFEQSVPTGGFDDASRGPLRRVSFGTDYARESLAECFVENEQHFPILLPVKYETEIDELRYLRLHNGTIWRWNRPLIGFDSDGTPHVRIEHRVLASNPSLADNIANVAFYYGLVHYYATISDPAEDTLDFAQVRDNFYTAAQHGINHNIEWIDNKRLTIQKLTLERLLPEAETGLSKLGIDEQDIKYYLGIIEHRITCGQTGSDWQHKFAKLHNYDMNLLTSTYFNNQKTNKPVHEWDFETLK
jgi:gamma-glutamyl:cysteine ligase YbdK (ATP-grasp superfamily)